MYKEMSSIETKKLIKKFKIKFNPENLIFKYEVYMEGVYNANYIRAYLTLCSAKRSIKKIAKRKNKIYTIYINAYSNNNKIVLEEQSKKEND